MNNFSEKLQHASEGLRLSHDERASMRAALARHIGAASVVSPVRVTLSPYLFVSQRWMVALASFVLVVFAGGSTAFASQGALPGSPLYPIKVNVIEPITVALAPSPVAKAAVHVALAQKRVEEAEVLVQQGTLSVSTGASLAANFEAHAQSADALANEVESEDPAAAVQIKTQLHASSAVGGAVLAALGEESKDENVKEQSKGLSVRVLALGRTPVSATLSRSAKLSEPSDDARHADEPDAQPSATLSFAAAPAPKAEVRTMAVATVTTATSSVGSSATSSATGTGALAAQSAEGSEDHDSRSSMKVAGFVTAKESTAAQLQMKAQNALNAARAQLSDASSTLSATTTLAVEASLAGIKALITGGSKDLNDSSFDAAVRSFTDAYSRALKLQGLLKAQKSVDSRVIAPLLQLNFFDDHRDDGDN